MASGISGREKTAIMVVAKLRILNAFNMAQDAYHVTKAMRDRGLDADLLVLKNNDNYSDPNWEVANSIQQDWIKVLNPLDRLKTYNLYKLFRDYDIVFCHVPVSLYAQFMPLVKWIPYDAGLIRYLPHKEQSPTYDPPTAYRKIRLNLLKRSYQKAKAILFTNPDTIRFFKLMSLEDKLRFVPFAIDTERYSPDHYVPNDILTFFSPTRQSWAEKGNDLLIYAFYRLLKYCNAKLILTAWGPDTKKSIGLLDRLGILKHVQILYPCNKQELIERYRKADVVCDQFVLGSYGTSSPEAMSCEKPVITYLSSYHKYCFGEFPPYPQICNVNTVEEICESMLALVDENLRKEIGVSSRRYVMDHHDGNKVVDTHISVAREMIER